MSRDSGVDARLTCPSVRSAFHSDVRACWVIISSVVAKFCSQQPVDYSNADQVARPESDSAVSLTHEVINSPFIQPISNLQPLQHGNGMISSDLSLDESFQRSIS